MPLFHFCTLVSARDIAITVACNANNTKGILDSEKKKFFRCNTHFHINEDVQT